MNGFTRRIRQLDTGTAGRLVSYVFGFAATGISVLVATVGMLLPFWHLLNSRWGEAFLSLFLLPVFLALGVMLYAIAVDLIDNAEGWYDEPRA